MKPWDIATPRTPAEIISVLKLAIARSEQILATHTGMPSEKRTRMLESIADLKTRVLAEETRAKSTQSKTN